MNSPEVSHMQEQSPSILQTVRQSSPTKRSYPKGSSHSRQCIQWDKDGNPYLPGVGRGSCLLRDGNIRTVHIPTTGNKTDPCLPTSCQAFHVVSRWWCLPQEFQASCWDAGQACKGSDPDLTYLDMAHGQPNVWDNHAHPHLLVGEWYWTEDLGFRQIDSRHLSHPWCYGSGCHYCHLWSC